MAKYEELYTRLAQIEQTAPALGRSRRAPARPSTPARWRRPAAIAATGVAVAALAGGGGLWAAGGIGGGENGPTQSARAQSADENLARSYAPVLRLSSGERFFPIDRSAFVSVANVVRKVRFLPLKVLPFDHTIGGFPGKAQCPPALSCTYALDIARLTPLRDKPAAYVARQQSLYPNGWDPVVYWHVVRYPTGATAVQYWLLFFYNNFLNQHEADWEQVTLELDPAGQPVRAFYSSHQGGERSLWAALPQAAGHPVVFVGGGSHANYFSAGKHDVPIVRASRKLVVEDTADGCGRLLAPAEVMPVIGSVEADCATRGKPKPVEEARTYRLAELSAPSFPGFYGYGNYVLHGLLRVGNGPGEPQRRAAWKDPLSLFGQGL